MNRLGPSAEGELLHGLTAYRMDEIPLPLRPALNSPYPTDEDVLKRIVAAVRKKPAWYGAATGDPAVV